MLELVQEFEVQEILLREGFLTHDGLHGLHVLTDGVVRVQLRTRMSVPTRHSHALVMDERERKKEIDHLVRDLRVVPAGAALSDGALHETRQGRQNVDRRVDLPVVQLTIDVDLPLRDVARQVGDRMRDICDE